MKPGTKLKSTVCDTEVMVIRAAEGDIECGGAAMVLEKPTNADEIDPEHANGTQMGKRYVDADDTIELLCVKPGQGSLAFNGVALSIKATKSLPSSD